MSIYISFSSADNVDFENYLHVCSMCTANPISWNNYIDVILGVGT